MAASVTGSDTSGQRSRYQGSRWIAITPRRVAIPRAAIAALEEALKYAPAGSESVVDNLKTAIAAAQSAYNNLASINKQIYVTVEKTVEQNVATVKAAGARAKSAKKR